MVIISLVIVFLTAIPFCFHKGSVKNKVMSNLDVLLLGLIGLFVTFLIWNGYLTGFVIPTVFLLTGLAFSWVIQDLAYAKKKNR